MFGHEQRVGVAPAVIVSSALVILAAVAFLLPLALVAFIPILWTA